ncbi:CcmD family protein [Natronorubrum sp. A-ect3]
MEYLLLVAFGSIFAALVMYVLHLRSRLTEIEQRLEDVTTKYDSEHGD